jgi:ferredoxin
MANGKVVAINDSYGIFPQLQHINPKEDSMANPTVDKDLCIGCALCSQACPDVFEMGSDGIAEVKSSADPTADCVQEAIDQCPVGAIGA